MYSISIGGQFATDLSVLKHSMQDAVGQGGRNILEYPFSEKFYTPNDLLKLVNPANWMYKPIAYAEIEGYDYYGSKMILDNIIKTEGLKGITVVEIPYIIISSLTTNNSIFLNTDGLKQLVLPIGYTELKTEDDIKAAFKTHAPIKVTGTALDGSSFILSQATETTITWDVEIIKYGQTGRGSAGSGFFADATVRDTNMSREFYTATGVSVNIGPAVSKP